MTCNRYEARGAPLLDERGNAGCKRVAMGEGDTVEIQAPDLEAGRDRIARGLQ